MIRGDILGFTAWSCRVFLTTSKSRCLVSCQFSFVSRSPAFQKTATVTIPEIERAHFCAFPAKKKNDGFAGSFHDGSSASSSPAYGLQIGCNVLDVLNVLDRRHLLAEHLRILAS
jgi:hypothetical protein